eukprot:3457723-Amphidinium_carterae.1
MAFGFHEFIPDLGHLQVGPFCTVECQNQSEQSDHANISWPGSTPQAGTCHTGELQITSFTQIHVHRSSVNST